MIIIRIMGENKKEISWSSGGDCNKQGKNKRRTRNESNENRNFSCRCGKSYLSYPALYLHLRNKHEGRVLDGTLLPKDCFVNLF